MNKSIIQEIIISLFILLFLYTGLVKIIDNETFLTALRKSPQLGPFASILSILIPLLELIVVAAMLIPRTRRLGLYGFLGMMSIFTIYITFMLYFKSTRPCTCGGIIVYMNWHQHLYFNTGFTFLAIVALWLDKKITRDSFKQMETVMISPKVNI